LGCGQQKKEIGVFKRILYPTDFSEVAAKAVDYLKRLRDAGAEEVIVLNVIHQRVLDTIGTIHSVVYFQDGRYEEDPEEAERQIEADRRKRLEPLVEELTNAGYSARGLVRKGVPRKEILKVEQEQAVSLIVMGSHGRSNVAEMLIGSVSEKVIRRSQNPVLIVKR
jgi:nucleotide-binding universal stress UspA family protein